MLDVLFHLPSHFSPSSSVSLTMCVSFLSLSLCPSSLSLSLSLFFLSVFFHSFIASQSSCCPSLQSLTDLSFATSLDSYSFSPPGSTVVGPGYFTSSPSLCLSFPFFLPLHHESVKHGMRELLLFSFSLELCSLSISVLSLSLDLMITTIIMRVRRAREKLLEREKLFHDSSDSCRELREVQGSERVSESPHLTQVILIQISSSFSFLSKPE